MTANAARTRGVHHLGLTVPELESALRFFLDGLGHLEVIAPAAG